MKSLLHVAEPLYAASWSSAAKQADRHAKTMDVARREMMVCVGLILCERLTRLDFGLFEAAQACCQVARATLLAVRCAVEDAVEANSDALADANEEDRLVCLFCTLCLFWAVFESKNFWHTVGMSDVVDPKNRNVFHS